MTGETKDIYRRVKVLVNTDPQRRCYDGHHFKSEVHWSAWGHLETVPAERAEERLQFWRELNDYAVSQRGKGARWELELRDTLKEERT